MRPDVMRVPNRSCSTRNNSSPTATERLGDTGLWLVEAPGQREVVFIWSHPMSILVVLCVGGLAIFAALMTPGTAGGLILAAVTAFFGYILAAIVFNRTHIRIDAEVLSVRHGPVPWPGNKDLRNSDIVALRAHRKRDNEGTDLFEVRWVDRQGKPRVLVRHLHSAEQAREMIEHLAPLLDAAAA